MLRVIILLSEMQVLMPTLYCIILLGITGESFGKEKKSSNKLSKPKVNSTSLQDLNPFNKFSIPKDNCTGLLDLNPLNIFSVPKDNCKSPLDLGKVPQLLKSITSKTVNFQESFNEFKTTFKKVYKNIKEEKKRIAIFIDNYKRMLELGSKPNLGYKLKMNTYGDWTTEEVNKLNGMRTIRATSAKSNKSTSKKRNRGKCSKKTNKTTSKKRTFTYKKRNPTTSASKVKRETKQYFSETENVDWRTKDAVTPVRMQGDCGSCYAFAAVTALESQFFLKTGNLQKLSPQHLVDCLKDTPRCAGCKGGNMDVCYQYIKDNGIASEDDYPYRGDDYAPCQFDQEKSVGKITDFINIDKDNDEALEKAVRTIGPIVIGFHVYVTSFRYYSEGIYYEPKCNKDAVNHAMVLIGYGTEDNGEKYWLIQNSYDTSWGINGTGKISRKAANHCGISSRALYPVV